MNLEELTKIASIKEQFTELRHYVDFCLEFLSFIETPQAIQAEIISQNENCYRFLQFKNPDFSVTRPLNTDLFYRAREAKESLPRFLKAIGNAKRKDTPGNRRIVNRAVYTIQQSIGAALDALPAGKSNQARKINGDLFERLIRLILLRAGVDCTSGIVKIPVTAREGSEVVEFTMNYQHDLIVKSGAAVKVVGSVKTSSKDRLDKIFIDKFLLARLTGKDIPHIAIFLNDVQRKGKNPREYGVSTTFLPGHFKGYTVKLNPLDGVYYFDIRPNMLTEPILRDRIRTFDCLLFQELWTLLERNDSIVAEVKSLAQ